MENETKTRWKFTLEEWRRDSCRKTRKEVHEMTVQEMVVHEMEVQKKEVQQTNGGDETVAGAAWWQRRWRCTL